MDFIFVADFAKVRDVREQRNELRSQFGFIHLVYSADLRHSNLPTEAM
jgi:hypothetical protein